MADKTINVDYKTWKKLSKMKIELGCKNMDELIKIILKKLGCKNMKELVKIILKKGGKAI